MGIGRRFTANRAKAEPLAFIEARSLQLAVVEDQALALALLQKKLAVVGLAQRLGGNRHGAAAVKLRAVEDGRSG